ncbi:MAG: sigma-70 family RNA polymerase sigma factor [Pseudomonadota bacterium]
MLEQLGTERSQAVFLSLYEFYAPRLKAYAMRLGADDAQAEELAQETMLTVWRRAGRFDASRASASTWIFTIMRNKRIDLFRRESRRINEPDYATNVEVAGPDEAFHASSWAAAIDQAVEQLPQNQAEVIKKAFVEDMTHTSIAADLDLPLGTVKSRIRLALDRLRRSMDVQSHDA